MTDRLSADDLSVTISLWSLTPACGHVVPQVPGIPGNSDSALTQARGLLHSRIRVSSKELLRTGDMLLHPDDNDWTTVHIGAAVHVCLARGFFSCHCLAADVVGAAAAPRGEQCQYCGKNLNPGAQDQMQSRL